MYFIGDIHGKIDAYRMLLAEFGNEPSIQLGDFGFGFSTVKTGEALELPAHHRFIRGNHDNPELCRKHPNYLGDFGYLPEGLFFVSGGLSVDKAYRIPYVSWWESEQLTSVQMSYCYDLYCEIKPTIVVSHECPEFLIPKIVTNPGKLRMRSATAEFLEILWHEHQPTTWVFGHHHNTGTFQVENTKFVALNELGTAQILLKE
jgi:predicted phosphodiesterase